MAAMQALIGSVHAHQSQNNHQHSTQQSQSPPQSQAPVAGTGASAGGPGATPAVAARAGGMFCYHCPPSLPAPRLPPSLEYSFAPTHPWDLESLKWNENRPLGQ
ncbi:hypothetical protein PV326_010395 [Microctonus aethiopoides]|nr:hypothetical protein PV326_010395 [Microctonus aethiopoides]